VNGIAPGLVDTELTEVTTLHPERLAGSIARIPQRRLGTPADWQARSCSLPRRSPPMSPGKL